jgi:hypothetical protein
MLTNDERMAVCDCVADFSIRLFSAARVDEQAIHTELDIFFEFFCRALEIAKRDGVVRVRESIGASNN